MKTVIILATVAGLVAATGIAQAQTERPATAPKAVTTGTGDADMARPVPDKVESHKPTPDILLRQTRSREVAAPSKEPVAPLTGPAKTDQ